MSNSIRAILDVAMTFFPPCLANSNSEASLTLQRAIEQFLQRKLSFEQMCAISQKIAGTSQPIERLNKILETSPDPIPVPDELRNKYKGNRRKTRAWSQYEDQRLLAGIYRNGIENWTSISKFVGNARTRSQCSQRWYRGLDPAICKDQWTKEEEQKLVDLINTHGDKSWTKIASKLGNRSDVQCRYKYRQLQKEKAKEGKVLAPELKQPIEKDNPADYERPAARRLGRSLLTKLDSNNADNFLINPNAPSILIAQAVPISVPVGQQQSSMQLAPSIIYTPQSIPSTAFISPSGSYVCQSNSPQIVLQSSHSQQSLQQPYSVHAIQNPQPAQQVRQPIQVSQIQQFPQIPQIQQISQTPSIQQIQPIQQISQTPSIQHIQPIQQIIQPQQIPIQIQPIQIQLQPPIQPQFPQQVQQTQQAQPQYSQQMQQPSFHIQRV